MTRPGGIFVGAGLLVLAALGVTAWVIWREPPPPPPSTCDEVYETVTGADPAKLSDLERDKWVAKVGGAIRRLPPHEFGKLIPKVMADAAWHERFKSLPPDQRRKMADLISQEQQLQMMLQMVDALQKMPEPIRKQMMILGRERMKQAGQLGMTKERMAERIASTTPTQRAKFVGAMRDLRIMAQEAGIRE